MKPAILSSLVLVGAMALTASAQAAAVESVTAARASTPRQKLAAFLSQDAVVKQMTAMGLSRAEVDARLAKLSDAQLETLAAQVDLIQAGGTIQSGQVNTFGPLTYVFRQIGIILHNLYSLLFSWTDWK